MRCALEYTRTTLQRGLVQGFRYSLHALTGCDSTSYLCGIRKTTAWATFKEYHGLLYSVSLDNSGETRLHTS